MAISEAAYKAQVSGSIRRLCGVAGWRSKELGERAGLSESTVSKILSGTQLINLSQLTNVLLAFKDAPEFKRYSIDELRSHVEMGTPLVMELGKIDPSGSRFSYRLSASDLGEREIASLPKRSYALEELPLASIG